MTARRDFDGFLSDWLDDKAGRSAPDYADEILARTSETRQRPRWSSLGRWLPMESALRERQGLSPRLVWLLALLALLVVMAAFALLAGVGSFHAPRFGASANGSIVFVDGGALRIADEDGTVVSSGTAVPDGADQLTFSPDGTKLAYRTLKSPASLVIADPDGSHPVVVAAAAAAEEPIAWSPDGRRIAFAVLTGNGEAIWAVDADGHNLNQLTANEADGLLDPAWSPDGTWIAFFSGADRSSAISLVHPDGTGLQTLKVSYVDRDGLAWSPDPARLRLTYTAEDIPRSEAPPGSTQGAGLRHRYIRVYDLATARETRVTEASILSGTVATWSPDGTRIAWWDDGTHTIPVNNGVADGKPTLVGPRVASGCLEHPELAARAICGPARWSPDSRWLFGPGIGGTAIVFELADGTPSSHSIILDHPANAMAGSDWQSVAP